MKATTGNPSYAGYEYQIGVTVWVALYLMLAKEAAEWVVIEPRSHEDIEASVREPENASLRVTAEGGRFELVVQAKSRSTDPWSTTAFADVLNGKHDKDGAAGAKARARPLAVLAANATKHYIFVTNESVQAGLRPHRGDHLFDFPEVHELPPYARAGFTVAAQAALAPRILICDGVTVEILQGRIERLLAQHGHVPPASHPACIRALRDAVRQRMMGADGGRWTKADLQTLLVRHGGSVLPTRTMDHYVRPNSYDAIRRSLDNLHAVVIAGPSGTGKTLTADILELDLRREVPPFEVVGEEYGPGYVRGQFPRSGPIVFHLRDPWGGNRLSPEADRWSDELPKLLRSAGAGRKFIITSRSDILQSAGQRLASGLRPYLVPIEIEDYGPARLAEIYDRISSDLSVPTLALAKAYRDAALQVLSRPYEIDRFLVALGREDANSPREAADIAAESQVDAISSVVADQIAAFGSDGVKSAAVIWAVLSARGTLAVDVIPRLLRRLRQSESALRPDVDGLTDFLVAGRNLRRDGNSLAFYHPRVEEGLRIAIMRRKSDAEHVLAKIADALAAWDSPGSDWGIETVLGVLRSVNKLKEVELKLSSATCFKLDAYLDTATASAEGHNDFERALRELARFGSADHLPAKLARMLVEGGPRDELFRETWTDPAVSEDVIKALRADAHTRPLVERFIRDVLPFSRTDYNEEIVPLLVSLCPDSGSAFSDALDNLMELGGPSQSVEAIVAGVLRGDRPDFDAVVDRIAAAEAEVDEWMEREHRAEARRAEEHSIDAYDADCILQEPGDRYYNPRKAMKVAVRLRRSREGIDWIPAHQHRRLLVYALADLLGNNRGGGTPTEMRVLLECADDWAQSHAWWAVAQHWDPSLHDLLDAALRRADIEDDGLRHQLIEIAAAADSSDESLDAHLQNVASATTKDRRLQLVADLITLSNIGSRKHDQAVLRARAERLTRSFDEPEAGIAQALAAALGGDDLKSVGDMLTEAAGAEVSHLLLTVAPTVLRPLVRIAAVAGLDSLDGVRRLLATENATDGLAALHAMRISHHPTAKSVLEEARNHPKYAVRRAALTELVATAEASERQALVAASEDASADVRLAWADMMRKEQWPEAVESLVALLGDRRDFSSDQGYGQTWAQHSVGRAAAAALGAYETLPGSAIDALLAAATSAPDPFVACAALYALANKDDDRITSVLMETIGSPGLPGSPLHRPVAQATAWALFDRAAAKRLVIETDELAIAARDDAPEIAGPLLMAIGIVGGDKRDELLADLRARQRNERVSLVEATAAAANTSTSDDPPIALLRRLAAGESIEQFQTEERERLQDWSRSFDVEVDVNYAMAWLLSAVFRLPVSDSHRNPRAFNLPERTGVLTMRSLSPAREEYQSVDDGF